MPETRPKMRDSCAYPLSPILRGVGRGWAASHGAIGTEDRRLRILRVALAVAVSIASLLASPVRAVEGEAFGARASNAAMRNEMRKRDNYFEEVELVATGALTAVGYGGPGAVSERSLTDVAAYFGFTIARVQDLPPSTRSISDVRDRVERTRRAVKGDPEVARARARLGWLCRRAQRPRSG